MARTFVALIYLSVILANLTLAAVFQAEIDEQEDHPRKCYLPNNPKVFFKPGSTYYDTKACVAYTCSLSYENKKKSERSYHVEGVSCGVVAARPPCKVVPGPKGARYPKCCKTVECPKPEGY